MKWLQQLLKCSSSDPSGWVRGVNFNLGGWTLRRSSSERMVWSNDEGDALSLDRVDNPADELPPPNDLQLVRRYCRGLAENRGGGLVAADVIEIGRVPMIQLIYKREQLPAYAYTGMSILPFEHHRFVIVIASVECGVTGVRDAIVTAELAEQGKLVLEEIDERLPGGASARVKGWFTDPYDLSYSGRVLCSLADNEKYDRRFPEHPLTKVRAFFRELQRTVQVSETSST